MRYTADTVEFAIEKGLQDLKADKNQVEIKIISQGKKGFLGFFKQLAEVEINLKSSHPVKLTEKSEKQDEKVVPPTTTTNVDLKSVREEELASVVQDLGYYLADVTKYMGIETVINVRQQSRVVYYNFDTQKPGLLVGKRGKTLNSLQLLAQNYMDKYYSRRIRVELDVGQYRQTRKDILQKMALQKARQVKLSKSPFKFDPMPSFERKIIHAALAKESGVKTISKGNEPYRYVMIQSV